jgi:hypothetical protein
MYGNWYRMQYSEMKHDAQNPGPRTRNTKKKKKKKKSIMPRINQKKKKREIISKLRKIN